MIVNLQKTPKDKHATLLVRGRVDKVCPALMFLRVVTLRAAEDDAYARDWKGRCILMGGLEDMDRWLLLPFF